MQLSLKKTLLIVSVAGSAIAAAAGTFVGLNSLAEEREHPGTRVSDCGLFRKIPGENALFHEKVFSAHGRRCVLMLAREPQCEAELHASNQKLKHLSETFPPGDFLFVADDSGRILLQREIPKTRKIFELADEVKILSARLRSVPVNYFPADKLRGKIRADLFEGNTEFPVPATYGGVR